MHLASDKQINFLATLVRERVQQLASPDDGIVTYDDIVGAMNFDALSKGDASTLIGRLKELAPDPDLDMPGVVESATRKGKGNRPGQCSTCLQVVRQDEGYYYLTSQGKWAVHHKRDACPQGQPIPKRIEIEPGFFRSLDGEIVQVYVTQNKRHAGKVLDESGTFRYRSGALRLVQAGGVKLSPDEVVEAITLARFGVARGSAALRKMAIEHSQHTGECMFCRKVITTTESKTVGYGPSCADKYGLPWG